MFYLNLIKFLKRQDKPLLQLATIISWCIVLFGSFVILFKQAEQVNWEEAIWQAWQTFTTVGYGNQPAVTTWGRIVTMLISTLGIAFLGALFSAAFNYKLYQKTQKRLGYMKNHLKNGYVIFNYPGEHTLYQFIKQLRVVEQNIGVCLVDDNIGELPEMIAQLPKVHFMKGSILSKSTFERAQLHHNKAIIIFPVDAVNSASDGATKTTVELVKKFVGNRIRIIHLLVSEENNWMFEGLDTTEVLSNLGILALVQECHDRFSSPIIKQLLSNTEGANPKTVQVQKIIGWTWAELLIASLSVSKKKDMPCNIFSLVRRGQANNCPHPDTVLEAGDMLSIIVDHNFSWEIFEKALMAIK